MKFKSEKFKNKTYENALKIALYEYAYYDKLIHINTYYNDKKEFDYDVWNAWDSLDNDRRIETIYIQKEQKNGEKYDFSFVCKEGTFYVYRKYI